MQALLFSPNNEKRSEPPQERRARAAAAPAEVLAALGVGWGAAAAPTFPRVPRRCLVPSRLEGGVCRRKQQHTSAQTRTFSTKRRTCTEFASPRLLGNADPHRSAGGRAAPAIPPEETAGCARPAQLERDERAARAWLCSPSAHCELAVSNAFPPTRFPNRRSVTHQGSCP